MVRQTDAAGNTSAEGELDGAVSTDGVVPGLLAAGLEHDLGSSGSDGITNDGTVVITGGLESGASWQYTTNGGTSWNVGTGTSFDLTPGTYAAGAVQLRQVDGAGNVGTATPLGAITIDVTPPAAPTATLSGLATVDVGGLETGATWAYSTNGGGTWTTGTGSSFELPAGVYDADDVLVRQTDLAGNTGNSAALAAVTVVGPDAVDDTVNLDMGAQTSVIYPSETDTDVDVIGLAESTYGADNTMGFTISADRSGDVRIEVSQTALVAVGDAYRVDVIDAAGNVVYSAAGDDQVADALGLDVLGVVGDDALVAIVSGLPPGDYRVVVRNDQSLLGGLLDTDVGGVSLQELGDSGVVLGAENQEIVLDTVEDLLNDPLLGLSLNLGTLVARPALELLLDGLVNPTLGDLVGVLTTLTNNLGLNSLLDEIVDAVADNLLSNTLTLLQHTTITTTVTEYEFANEIVTGNVITGAPGVGVDDVAGGATVTKVVNSDGVEVTNPPGGPFVISGEHGILTIYADGHYSYDAYGYVADLGQSEVFTYTLSDGVSFDTATLTINLDGNAVTAVPDTATAGVEFEYVETSSGPTAAGSYGTDGLVGLPGEPGTIDIPFTVDANTQVDLTVYAITGGGLIVGLSYKIEVLDASNAVVASDTFVSVADVLGLSLGAGASLTANDLDPGAYTIRVTSASGIPVADFNTAIHLSETITHTDQYTVSSVTSASGDLTDNDEPGSNLTTLQIYDDATSDYVDVDAGTPVTVQGLYGSLEVNADGTYTYTPDNPQAHFDSAVVDSFDYQLTHPSGEIAQTTLEVTLEPSGDGAVVVSPFMAMMSFSETGGDELGTMLDTFLPDTAPSNDNDASDPTGSGDGSAGQTPADPLDYLSTDPLNDTDDPIHNVV